jgi:hypothetical protein
MRAGWLGIVLVAVLAFGCSGVTHEDNWQGGAAPVSIAKTKCLKESTGTEGTFTAQSERKCGRYGLSGFESERVLTEGAGGRYAHAPRSNRTGTTTGVGL